MTTLMMPARPVVNRWTSFGTQLQGAARKNSYQALVDGGLDWSAEKVPLIYNWQGKTRTQNGQFSVVRSDTGDSIGTVGDHYTIFQNHDQAKFFDELVNSGYAEFDTVGCLKGGAVTWIMAKLDGMVKEVVEGDKVGMNVLFANSHDGSMKVHLGYTPIRVVCRNTLKMAIQSNASELFKIKHKAGIYVAVNQIQSIISKVGELFEMTVEKYQLLARSGAISQKDLEKIILKTVLKKDADDDSKELATRTENNLTAIMDAIRFSPGSDIAQGSAWSTYNGVNWWLFNNAPTRKRKDGTEGDDNDSILHSGWFGQNAKKETNLLESLLQLVA